MAPKQHTPALRRPVPRAVGVSAHAAEEGEGGEGEDVLADSAGVSWPTAPARPDQMGGGVARSAAWRGELQGGLGRGAVCSAVVGVL